MCYVYDGRRCIQYMCTFIKDGKRMKEKGLGVLLNKKK